MTAKAVTEIQCLCTFPHAIAGFYGGGCGYLSVFPLLLAFKNPVFIRFTIHAFRSINDVAKGPDKQCVIHLSDVQP